MHSRRATWATSGRVTPASSSAMLAHPALRFTQARFPPGARLAARRFLLRTWKKVRMPPARRTTPTRESTIGSAGLGAVSEWELESTF